MAKRRSFVPENPNGLCLEGRLAPSVSSWFTHAFKEIGNHLTPVHHSKTASQGIAQLWKESSKLSKPQPASIHGVTQVHAQVIHPK